MNPLLMDLLLYVMFSILVGAAGWIVCIHRARTSCQAVAIRNCSRALNISLLLLMPLIYIHLFVDASITSTLAGWLLFYGGYYSFIVFTLGSVVYVWLQVKRCNATCATETGHQQGSHHPA